MINGREVKRKRNGNIRSKTEGRTELEMEK
jgi:hypothetical protein